MARARLAAVLAQRNAIAAAEAELDRAERTVAGRDPVTSEVVRLYRCFVELATDDEAAAFARLESAQQDRDDGASLVEVSDDARQVLRTLAQSMSRVGGGPSLEIGPRHVGFARPAERSNRSNAIPPRGSSSTAWPPNVSTIPGAARRTTSSSRQAGPA